MLQLFEPFDIDKGWKQLTNISRVFRVLLCELLDCGATSTPMLFHKLLGQQFEGISLSRFVSHAFTLGGPSLPSETARTSLATDSVIAGSLQQKLFDGTPRR